MARTSGWRGWVPKRLTPQQRRAARLFAMGMRTGDVAAALGVHGSTVSCWQRGEEFKKLVDTLSLRIHERLTDVAIQRVLARLNESLPPRSSTSSPTGYRAPAPPSILPRPAKAQSPVQMKTTRNGDMIFGDQRWTPDERAILRRLIASGRPPGSRPPSTIPG